MQTVTSKDGTTIAYERTGSGPAVILVVGAFNDHTTGAPLARSLEDRYTVFTYDRRGRGKSGDAESYEVAREIEDLDALLFATGGSAFTFGYSSGAVLALRAAAQGLAIRKLALYDPPPCGPRAAELSERLAVLVAADRRGDAVELFQIDGVGIPRDVVERMRQAPFRPALEMMAHTLVYEMKVLSDVGMPPAAVRSVRVPTLILVGERNPDVLLKSAEAFGGAVPGAEVRTLEGQTHDLVPAAVAPELERFFV